MATNAPLKIFQKSRIAIETLITDTINYTVDTFKQGRTNFTVASAYGQIIFVLENLAQLILLYNEDSITELNINTATRTNSVNGLARLAGHNPTRAISSTGTLTIKSKPNADTLSGGVIVIPNFTKIKCQNNGQTYLLDLPTDDIRIPIDGSKNGLAMKIIQGAMETNTAFTGTGGNLQTFSVNFQQSALIDNFNVSVFINGEKWKQYDSLYDIPYKGKGYMVKTGLIDGIDIIFGNGFFGLQPLLGADIRVEYLTTSGEAGNLLLADGEESSFQWQDTGFSTFGDEININDFLLLNASENPDFGTNPEPVALTRIIAPKTSRNFVLANPDSYIIYLEKFNMFSVIDAFTLENLDTTDDKIIYLFLIPDVRKKLKTNENYFNIDETRFLVTDDQKNKILTLIDRSGGKVVGTELQIVDPIVSRFVINIALIVFDDAAEDNINAEIIKRLSDYFITVRRRDRIPRSDIITVLENIDGIDSLNISIISERDEQVAISATTNQRSSTPPPPPRIDEFGDILIYQDELPIIRGGWTDRNGLTYDVGLNPAKPSSVNIIVKQIVPNNHNTTINQNNIVTLRGGTLPQTN